MATSKKPAAEASLPSAPAEPTVPRGDLYERAVADPLFREGRRRQQKGEAPARTFDLAWDEHNASNPKVAYEPAVDVAEYLRRYWLLLLLEGEEERAKAGRPSLLTAALLAKIEALAETGAKDPIIYRKLGIRHQLWSDWTKDPESDLNRALAKARATLAEDVLRGIKSFPKGWQAGVWLLTQHFPELFSRPNADTQINVNASASASLSIEVTPATLANLQERRRQQLASPHGPN